MIAIVLGTRPGFIKISLIVGGARRKASIPSFSTRGSTTPVMLSPMESRAVV